MYHCISKQGTINDKYLLYEMIFRDFKFIAGSQLCIYELFPNYDYRI